MNLKIVITVITTALLLNACASNDIAQNKTSSIKSFNVTKRLVTVNLSPYELSRINNIKGNAPKAVKTTIAMRLRNTNINSISKTPINSLYQMIAGRNVLYVNKTADYIVFGDIYDLNHNRDITQPIKDQISAVQETQKVDINKLPLAKAIHYGSKHGHKLYVLLDPDCPYCRALNRTLMKMKNIDVNELLYPIPQLHPGTLQTSRDIVCSADPAKYLQLAMHNLAIPRDRNKCNASVIQTVIHFANHNNLNGTPVLIRDDGAVVMGNRSAAFIRKWLNLSTLSMNSHHLMKKGG